MTPDDPTVTAAGATPAAVTPFDADDDHDARAMLPPAAYGRLIVDAEAALALLLDAAALAPEAARRRFILARRRLRSSLDVCTAACETWTQPERDLSA